MAMSMLELEKALRGLRLSGMVDTLEARALQVAQHHCDFLEALSNLVQDDLDRRKTRLIHALFLKVLPPYAGEELTDILMSRYEKHSSIITSNRSVDDWGKLLGDVVIVAPLLDRLYHHGHMLRFEGKSWRLHQAALRHA